MLVYELLIHIGQLRRTLKKGDWDPLRTVRGLRLTMREKLLNYIRQTLGFRRKQPFKLT